MSSPAPGPPELLSRAEVLRLLRADLTTVIGEDYVAELEIDDGTSFLDDLNIESIEFVALGELLEERYAGRVDFAGWIAGMEVEEIIDMTVGRLVDHILEVAGRPHG